ncbi:hypothetical protein L6164_014734 [Bauhinia variegata]|uniref:Uncharacterized protein n=1 Tax=Bauhinia variegata TaxID=167791 RepID=A0ACB9NJZ9_BAUVA|nr:hypothetical protein L6164_014734 [Bauhinia variegata]
MLEAPKPFLVGGKKARELVSELETKEARREQCQNSTARAPMEQNHLLALCDGNLLTNPQQYRRLEFWEAAPCVVRYMKGNPCRVILLRGDSELRLSSWCHLDWASCLLTRKSLTDQAYRSGLLFCVQRILSGNIQPAYVPTRALLVDLFTKALGPSQFVSLSNKLSIINVCVL